MKTAVSALRAQVPRGVRASVRRHGAACAGRRRGRRILYAYYGQRATTGVEAKVTKKLASDFARGLANWPGFTTWRFVTNSRFGPKATAQLNTLRDQHGEGSARPVVLELWRAPEDLWWKEVSRAVYAVTVYFFDSCDIFEEPPASFVGGVPNDVAAN